MLFAKADLEFASKLLNDFKKTQPRKKRQNINRAFTKITNSEPLNRLEKEAYTEFQNFLINYDFE